MHKIIRQSPFSTLFFIILTILLQTGCNNKYKIEINNHTATQLSLLPGRNASEFLLDSSVHPQGISLVTKIYLPDSSSLLDSGAIYPVAFGYHGSGGLFKEPLVAGNDCTEDLENKYQEMTDYLISQGVAVVWIDSFYSRDPRFCEDNSAPFQAFAPAVMDSNLQQVLSRLYDATIAEKEFCKSTRLDCNHFMRIGTSEGGTAAILPSHRFIDHSVSQLFDAGSTKNKLSILTDMVYAPLPTNRPQPQFVMAIAPGCGFYSAIPFSATGLTEDLYYPEQNIFLEIGTADTVPAECSTATGAGRRQLQAEEVQIRESILPGNYRYKIALYPGEGHPLWENRQADIKAKLTPLIQAELF